MFETTTRLFPYFFSLPSISFSSLWKTWKAGVLGRVGRKGLGAFSLLACPISLSIMVVAVHTWGNINKHGRVKPHSQESGFFGGACVLWETVCFFWITLFLRCTCWVCWDTGRQLSWFPERVYKYNWERDALAHGRLVFLQMSSNVAYHTGRQNRGC